MTHMKRAGIFIFITYGKGPIPHSNLGREVINLQFILNQCVWLFLEISAHHLKLFVASRVYAETKVGSFRVMAQPTECLCPWWDTEIYESRLPEVNIYLHFG